MATARRRTASGVRAAPELPPSGSLAARLFREGYAFQFFQAVRLLERIDPNRRPVGKDGPPELEVVRFRAHLSLSFPASQLYTITPPSLDGQPPEMTVTFFGLTGPSGILPRHYTELLVRLDKEARGPERTALRDWLDQFNHRLISLFYRAWTKYRFYIAYERRDPEQTEPDPFTQALYSFIGMGLPSLRKRLRVSVWETERPDRPERVLARLRDLCLIHYSGLLSQRPRNASALRALVEDYLGLPAQVCQFQGQWLLLDRDNQSALGVSNCRLGQDVVAGERVWNIVGRIRLRLGPLTLQQFTGLLPDRSPSPERKTFFLLCHLVRLYIGPELSFDVQLILKADEVPECRLEEDDVKVGARLGWNTWLVSQGTEHDASEAVFEGEELVWVNDQERRRTLGLE